MNLAQTMFLKAKWGVQDFFTKENGEVNIVSIVVLCGIAVLLALLFQEKMTSLITDLFTTISGNAVDAVSGSE